MWRPFSKKSNSFAEPFASRRQSNMAVLLPSMLKLKSEYPHSILQKDKTKSLKIDSCNTFHNFCSHALCYCHLPEFCLTQMCQSSSSSFGVQGGNPFRWKERQPYNHTKLVVCAVDEKSQLWKIQENVIIKILHNIGR